MRCESVLRRGLVFGRNEKRHEEGKGNACMGEGTAIPDEERHGGSDWEQMENTTRNPGLAVSQRWVWPKLSAGQGWVSAHVRTRTKDERSNVKGKHCKRMGYA